MSKSAFRSGRLAKAAFRAIICGLALAAVDGKAVRGQTGNDDRPFATKFFLDEPPNSNQLNIIPNAADLMVAKVRLIGRATYLIGRHQPLPKDLFYAKMDVLQVIRGDIKPGSPGSFVFWSAGTASSRRAVILQISTYTGYAGAELLRCLSDRS